MRYFRCIDQIGRPAGWGSALSRSPEPKKPQPIPGPDPVYRSSPLRSARTERPKHPNAILPLYRSDRKTGGVGKCALPLSGTEETATHSRSRPRVPVVALEIGENREAETPKCDTSVVSIRSEDRRGGEVRSPALRNRRNRNPFPVPTPCTGRRP